ncbi:E3 ubiquitin-protein ligase At1g12760-like [Tasmannia lanceolata]|uniref:E3 ubiquitin-protein ligase At1g12760-like n=1 Tax=Tasmannia lanceolata TaxID=3420 RepID=UPI0040638481
MAAASLEPPCEGQTDRHPLLMDQPENQCAHKHVLGITRSNMASTSGSHDDHLSEPNASPHVDGPSSSTQAPISQPSSSSITTSGSRNATFIRRRNSYGRRSRHRSPLNSGLWISIELVVTMSQIIASIVVLSLSRDENPQAPLFEWAVGYAAGCVATLPLLYWRYLHRNNQGTEQESTHAHQGSSQNNPPSDYISISIPRASEAEDRHTAATASRNGQTTGMRISGSRLNALVDHFKMALDCFFAVWFVVGNVWIFGGHSSSSEAPNLYRLCIAFLTFSCIGYAMPFILCAAICCCLPCIISILGFRDDLVQTRGANPESISALPTYKFKLKRRRNREESEINLEGTSEVGVLAAGTDKERTISAEDAVCCICLAKYADNEELRELPCTHFFHMECVDKWLKINALCPLCKSDIGETSGLSSGLNSGRRQGERRAGNGVAGDGYGSTIL